MAGLKGNIGWIMAQKQAAQGTLATIALPSGSANGAYRHALAGGGMGPARAVGQLAETDASRDQGVSFLQSITATGAPEFYTRDDSLGFWLQAALGADVVTGTTNFAHVITPSNSLPYISVWRAVSDTLWESFVDCKVSSLVIAGTAGNPITATATLQGRTPARLAADPSTTPAIPLSNGYAYTYNDIDVTLAGGATALCSGFTLTIDNNVAVQQTDSATPIDVTEGQRTVECDFDLIFSDLSEYNKFHYGSSSGTAASQAIYTTSISLAATNGINNGYAFALPSIAYTDFPVDVNPNGDPISVAVKAVAQRNAGAIVTATVNNQVAKY